jgi:hypothetical protein
MTTAWHPSLNEKDFILAGRISGGQSRAAGLLHHPESQVFCHSGYGLPDIRVRPANLRQAFGGICFPPTR